MKETINMFHSYGHGVVDHVILLNLEYIEEADRWVGFCAELGTSTYGETLSEAREELRDAVKLQLDEIDKLGYVWDFLQDNHVVISNVAVHESGFSLAQV